MNKKQILSLVVICSLVNVHVLPMSKKLLQVGSVLLSKKNNRAFFKKPFYFLPKKNIISVANMMYSSLKKDEKPHKIDILPKKHKWIFTIQSKNIKYWTPAAGSTTFLSINGFAFYCLDMPYNWMLGSYSVAFTFLSSVLVVFFLSYKTVRSKIEHGEDVLKNSVERYEMLYNASKNLYSLIERGEINTWSGAKIIGGMQKELDILDKEGGKAKKLCSLSSYNPDHINAYHIEQCCVLERDFKNCDHFLREARQQIEKCEILLKSAS